MRFLEIFLEIMKKISDNRASVFAIIFVNLIPLAEFYFFGISSLEIMLTYWGECIIIAFFSLLKIRKAIGAKRWADARILLISVFIILYGGSLIVYLAGIEHLIYMNEGHVRTEYREYLERFLESESKRGIDIARMAVALLAFFISHTFSYVTNYIQKKEYLTADQETIMTEAFIRTYPMNAAAYLCFFLVLPVITMVIAKTAVDIYSHLHERDAFRRV
jgi:hypothetical protein